MMNTIALSQTSLTPLKCKSSLSSSSVLKARKISTTTTTKSLNNNYNKMSSTTKEEDITLVIEQQNQKSLSSSSLQSKFARAAVGASLALSLALSPTSAALAANGLPDEEVKVLCDAECVKSLDSIEMVTTPSGLQYKDIIVGDGEMPPIGFQVVADYVAMNEKGLIFDNSVEKGKPNDIRLTGDPESATVIVGLDEGLLSMRSGGLRRLYIPGDLAFPKGLASAPGRPKIPPNSPVMFDVKLLYIPGLD
jgi:peptidylprolyl isomerase